MSGANATQNGISFNHDGGGGTAAGMAVSVAIPQGRYILSYNTSDVASSGIAAPGDAALTFASTGSASGDPGRTDQITFASTSGAFALEGLELVYNGPSDVGVTLNGYDDSGTLVATVAATGARSSILTFSSADFSGDADWGNIESFTIDFSALVANVQVDDMVVGAPMAATPMMSIGDVSQPEGISGTTNFSFPITLSEPSSSTVTVDFATSDDTAISGIDYTATSGTVTFPPGITSQTVPVAVQGETLDEFDETFDVVLSAPSNAILSDGTGRGTILNDDVAFQPALTLSPGSAVVAEGSETYLGWELDRVSGRETSFTVAPLTGNANDATDEVDYRFFDFNNDPSDDFTQLIDPGELSDLDGVFAPDIAVLEDDRIEGPEVIRVDLVSASGLQTSDVTPQTFTITDNDAATLSIADVSAAEGDAGTQTYTFTVTAATGGSTIVNSFSVDFATSENTATAGTDYASTSGMLTFPAGTVDGDTRTIDVTVRGDTEQESDETFDVTLSNIVTANNEDITLADASATGTLLNDDAPELTVTAGGSNLPNGGTFDIGVVDGVADAPTQTFTLQNTGTGDLTISGVTLGNTADFQVAAAPASPVGAGASTELDVQLTTLEPGTYQTTVSIANSDSDETPYAFTLQVTVGAPEADVFAETTPRAALPDGETFSIGRVTVGQSASQPFTIENNGTATLTISQVSEGGDTGAFTLSSSPASTVAPGSATTFDVSFDPASSGTASYTLSIATNDADEALYDLTLTGTADPRPLSITDGSAEGLDVTTSVTQGRSDNVVGVFALSAGTAGAALEGVTVTSDAPGAEGISTARLFGSDDDVLNVGTDVELDAVTVDPTNAPETYAFSGFREPIPTSVRYVILAIGVENGAPATDIRFFLDAPSDLVVAGAALTEVNGQAQATFAGLPLSNAAATLPVELAGFEAAASGEAVTLSWKTLTETNNAGFDIERRVGESGAWTSLQRIAGAGTTTEAQSYRFEDTALPYAADAITYRLRQVDVDGRESFSEEIVVTREAVSQMKLLGTYPNPAQSQATVRFAVPKGTDGARLVLYDLLGRQVWSRGVTQTGRQTMTLDTSTLASGMYFLRLTGDGQTRTEKLTVVR